jgi:hypothetical protein
MGWRFRRSLKIAPGIRWNISKGGTSWSFGPRGFKLNVGKRGIRRTISVPGTGLSHSQMISGPPESGQSGSTSRTLASIQESRSGPRPPRRFQAPPQAISPFTDDAAVSVAKQWATSNARLLGRLLPSCVTATERTTVERYRATYSIRSRQVVVKAEPVVRKTRPTGALPDPGGYDPWVPDISHQLEPKRALAACPTCLGEGRLTCPQCHGTVDIQCDACGGTGRTVSDRSGKIIKCRTCGADGRRGCSCRDGAVACQTCNGKGVVNAWLVVEEQLREETRVTGTPEFVATGPAEIVSANVEPLLNSSWPTSEVSDAVGKILQRPDLSYTPDPFTERVEQIAVCHERSEIATVRYQLAGRDGAIKIQAWNGEVGPTEDAMRPFQALGARILATGVCALLASLALVGWFVSRHSYYATSPQATILVLLAIALPILLTLPIAYAARPAVNRRLDRNCLVRRQRVDREEPRRVPSQPVNADHPKVLSENY